MSPELLSEDTLYKELYGHLRATDDVSFKLLGIVPLISGTGIVALFWGEDSVPGPVVWLLALFAASVTLALYRWELHNIGVCWWLARRIGAIEARWAERVNADELMTRELSELKPPRGVDEPHAEAQERRAERVKRYELMASKLSGLKPPLGIDKPHAEAVVYGTTVLVWLAVPWLYDSPPVPLRLLTGLYVGVSAVIGLFAVFSVVESLITHNWPTKGGTTANRALQRGVDARG